MSMPRSMEEISPKVPLAEDDLFQPTLTESDEPAGFNRPWSPSTLIYVVFFCGLPGGGFLFADNYRRLGQPKRFWPAIAISFSGSILFYGVVGFLAGFASWAGERVIMEIIARVYSVAFAFYFYSQQRHRFRIFGLSNQPAANPLIPAILAFVGTAAFAYLTVYAFGSVGIFVRQMMVQP